MFVLVLNMFRKDNAMIKSGMTGAKFLLSAVAILLLTDSTLYAEKSSFKDESREVTDQRMKWWRDARFGMFIHWGLYAVPAGEWEGKTGHAEWIRTTAKIPLDVYDKFVEQFNPVNFDADSWVKMAKAAGMKYIVITSKHHDGFCLWPSEQTEFDVASTPFKRDILAELKAACDKEGIVFCTYHSIMDWHHPDYPARKWEKERAKKPRDFDRYIKYMKAQLKEIITNYHPGVMWFDGEWENAWNHKMGLDLYEYVRGLQPDIIINNRVDKARRGKDGDGNYAGDFGTPEQKIPANGLPGVDWESCMTMNRHWGWNKNDHRWKSTESLVKKVVDIASKGGNYLLNIGPKADGTFPAEAIKRLKEIGVWMDENGEAVYGTTANPFGKVPFGRITAKLDEKTLYLHVFTWPSTGVLELPGMANPIVSATLLATPDSELKVEEYKAFPPKIHLPTVAPSPYVSVIKVRYKGDLKIPLRTAKTKATE